MSSNSCRRTESTVSALIIPTSQMPIQLFLLCGSRVAPRSDSEGCVCVCALFLHDFFYILFSQKPKWRRRWSQSRPRGIPESLFTLLRLKWSVTARQPAASLFCVLPETLPGVQNVRADRKMFVVPLGKWQERPKQTSSCFTCHKSLVWLPARPEASDLQSRSFKAVSFGSRAGGTTPRPQKTQIVPEALGNTAGCYLCLEGVCFRAAGLGDESCGEISGESGAGGAAVSDLARVTDTVWGDGGISLPSSGQIICQDGIIKMSWKEQRTQIITCVSD